MRFNIHLVKISLFLSLITSLSHSAIAAGSLEDSFNDLAKNRSGSKTTGQGISEGFDSLGKDKANPATGHGIEASMQDLEAYRAEEKVYQAEVQRLRMEQEAKDQDKNLEKECACILAGNCIRPIKLVYSDPTNITADERGRLWKQQNDEFEEKVVRPFWDGIRAKKPICEAWQAEGSKANSEFFKEQLRQQDKAVVAAQSAAAASARQRDALIEADIKRRTEQSKSEQAALITAEQNKKADKIAEQDAIKAAAKAAAAEQEEKNRQWCLADLAKGHFKCECVKYSSIKEIKACEK